MSGQSPNSLHVFVTGAAGFVGGALVRSLIGRGHTVSVAVRSPDAVPPGTAARCIGDLARVVNWGPALAGIDAVVHLAARVHVMESRQDADYEAANVRITLQLAEAAAAAGIRRFVFLSSIKAMGDSSVRRALTESDAADPPDPYGRSKLLAEQRLAALADRTGMQVACLRPPLVHGPGVRANMLSLLRWIDRGLPLPFAGIANRRSLISVGNLASAILAVLDHPGASSGPYLVADGAPLSTADLVRELAAGMDRPVRLFALPRPLLAAGIHMPGIGPRLSRLAGDLEIDDAHFRRTFGWTPPEDPAAALRATAAWYAANLSDRNRAGSAP